MLMKTLQLLTTKGKVFFQYFGSFLFSMNRSRDDFLISTQNGQEKESSNDDECEVSSQTIVIRDEPHETSCLCISVYSAVVIALVCVFLVLGRDYIKYVLLSLEETNLCISFAIFSFLFTVVSFPMTWGYILLNIAAGYLYGLLLGLVVVMVCALFGISLAHLVIKNCLRSFVLRRLTNDSIRSIMRVVDSDNGIKVVVLSRLTPIPFGLQNSLYAISNLSYLRYISASALGMLPSQGMHAYMGSTLRSMEEVISTSGSTPTAYVVFAVQLLMILVLLAYIIRRARMELDRTVQQFDHSKEDTPSDDELVIVVDSASSNYYKQKCGELEIKAPV